MNIIRCSCGAETPDGQGWQYLSITGRWRCPECYRGLMDVRSSGIDRGDPLPKDSIGALKPMPKAPPLHEKVKP